MKRGFASDNNSGIHPEILNAISAAMKDMQLDTAATRLPKRLSNGSNKNSVSKPMYILYLTEQAPMYCAFQL